MFCLGRVGHVWPLFLFSCSRPGHSKRGKGLRLEGSARRWRKLDPNSVGSLRSYQDRKRAHLLLVVRGNSLQQVGVLPRQRGGFRCGLVMKVGLPAVSEGRRDENHIRRMESWQEATRG